MVATLKLHCDVCAGVRVFEQPTCGERHGGECPDWACTSCGAAIFLAPAVILVDRRPAVVLRQSRKTPAKRAA
jgi:hypothetical protein